MLTITLNTPKRLPRFLYKKKWKRAIPATWDEMNTKQKTQAIIAFSMHEKEEKNKALEALALSWLKLPKPVSEAIDPAHLYAIIESIQQVDIENMPPASIIPDHSGQRTIEPQLSNINNIEYALADEFYTEFFETSSIAALHKLTAAIYAPCTKEGRANHESRKSVISNAETTAKWPDHIHLSTLYFFSQGKKLIHNTYGGWLFETPPENKDKDEPDEPTEKKEQNAFGWWGIFMDIAETGTFGNFNDVLKTNLHNTLIYLVKKKQQEVKHQKPVSQRKQY